MSSEKSARTSDAPAAVDRPQGKFQVDANGQAAYRVPIEVPPGIAGVEPALELVYGHQGPNGLVGVGWSLAGLSAITRTKATYAVDGFNGDVSYDDTDRLALDGQRLINVEGDYGRAGTLYYTEEQSWQHVRAETEGFTVVTKTGEVWRYGATADSRITAAGDEQKVRVWALSSATDRNGNTIEYHYTDAPLLGNGERGAADVGGYYLDRIGYSSNHDHKVAAKRFVQLTYEQRPDPIASYVGGYPVPMSYRLKQIDASLAGDHLARSYRLAYRTSSATRLSTLESITEAGDGTAALPPTRMSWQDVEHPGFDLGPSSTLDQHAQTLTTQAMDVNGDGRTDIVQVWRDHQNSLHATTYLATVGHDGGVTFERASDSELGSFPDPQQIFPGDFTGDGRTDLLIAYKGSNGNLKLAVFPSNGTGFEEGAVFDTGDSWLDTKHIQFFAMDANGDGRTDFVEAYAHFDPDQGNLLYFRTYLSKFGRDDGGFTSAIVSETDDPAAPPAVLAFWALDVNGDGMVDIARIWQRSDSHIVVTAYISVSRSLDEVSFAKRVKSDLGTLSLPNQIRFMPVDVNGDGVVDLLQIWKEPSPSGQTLHLTTFLSDAAGGFVAGPDATFEDQSLTRDDVFAMDFNGGGLTSIVGKWISGDDRLMFTVYLASPSGEYRKGVTFDAGDAGSAVELASFFPADANGDGKADLIRQSKNIDDQEVLRAYTSSGPVPDLVATITNALGGVVSIEYAALNDPDVYHAAGSTGFPATTPLRFPNSMTPTQFPVQAVIGQALYVVSEYAETNDRAVNRFAYASRYRMSYTGARLNLLGRGSEGFETITKLDLGDGHKTVKTYEQDFPKTGRVRSTRIEADGRYATDPRVAKNETHLLMGIDATEYTVFTRATGASDASQKVVEVLRTAARQEHYDYGKENFDYAIGHRWAYDAYGSVTLDSYLGYVNRQTGEPLDPDEVVYRHNRYLNHVDADGWVLGLPTYKKVSANAKDTDITKFQPGDLRLDNMTYFTDSTFNLESHGRWDDANGVYLRTSYEYDEVGNQKSETKPGGFVTRFRFDPDYRTFKMEIHSPPNADGVELVSFLGFDPRFGKEVARRDAAEKITISALDPFGRKAIEQGPVPDLPGAVGDANAVTPLVTGTADLRRTFQAAEVVTRETFSYLDDGQGGQYRQQRSLQKFPVGPERDFTWRRSYVDGRERERQTVLESGQNAGHVTTLMDYDSKGQPVLESLPFFAPSANVDRAPHAVYTIYDVVHRPIRKTTPAGADGEEQSVTTWRYGSGGEVRMTLAAGSASEYVQVLEKHFYDGKDMVRSIVVPEDDNAITKVEFDRIARLRRATDPPTPSNPKGVETAITYDSLDRRLTFDNPDQNTTGNPGVKAMTYAYDATTGRLDRTVDAAGETTSYTYDDLGRVKTKAFSVGGKVALDYDDAAVNGRGRLTAATAYDAGGARQSRHEFGYDAYGNTAVSTVTVTGEPSSFVTRSVYDPQKRVVAQTLPDASELEREFSFGKLVAQSLGGAEAAYPLDSYNAFGKPGVLAYGPDGEVVTRYTFAPTGLEYRESVRNTGDVLDQIYRYNRLSQVEEIHDQAGEMAGAVHSFTYAQKRLRSADVPGFAPASYAYDASGNLLQKEGVEYEMKAHFPVLGKRGEEVVYRAEPDACGRTRTRQAGGQRLTFHYDGFGSLSQVVSDGGDTLLASVSDYLGRRLQQTLADGTRILYISPSYQVTRPPSGEPSVTKYLLDNMGAAAAVTTGPEPGVLYFRRNHQKSTTHAFGSDGALVGHLAYGAYGEVRVLGGKGDFRPKYEQRQWYGNLGLYYFGARYYDPVIGRFLTPDTQLGSDSYLQQDVFNRFAFELNDPINQIDTTGHGSAWIAGLVIGLTVLAVGVAIVATGGLAAPLAAAGLSATAATVLGGAITGAVIGAGISASLYSVSHRDEAWGDFFKGYAVNMAVGAAVGFVSGGLVSGVGAAAESATLSIASKTVQFGARAAIYAAAGAPITAGADVMNQFMANVVDKDILHQDVSLDRGLAEAAITGAVTGGIAGVGQAAVEASSMRRLYEVGGEEFTSNPPQFIAHPDGTIDVAQVSDIYRTTRAGWARLARTGTLVVENQIEKQVKKSFD